MVHRPADSRLLNNLLARDKEYSKGLNNMLTTSHAGLSSLSAYASCSSPPASHIILAVSTTLEGADEALRRYAAAVDVWREQLKSLKALEDQVGDIMRDREILVTRLIKASKVDSHSKLNDAQGELQGCETHLAQKEKELEEKRVLAIREGLTIRCTAMVECGWAWGERGKEGLRALESLRVHERQNSGGSDVGSQGRPPLSHSQFHKPLPDPTRPSSDLSSLAPSQSASQIALVPDSHSRSNSYDQYEPAARLAIPSAHSINDLYLPNAARHTLSRRITEEEIGQAASSDEEDREVEVVENKRFSLAAAPVPPAANGRSGSPLLGRGFAMRSNTSNSGALRQGTMSDVGPASYRRSAESGGLYRGSAVGTPHTTRERKHSGSGFFGSLRGLFGGHKKDRDSDAGSEHETPNYSYGGGDRDSTIRPGKKAGRWATRTDKNLQAAQERGDDSSDDEGPSSKSLVAFPGGAAAGVTPPVAVKRDGTMESGKGAAGRKKSLKKAPGPPQDESIGAKRAEEWVGEERQRLDSASRDREAKDNVDRGWTSDGGIPVAQPLARTKSTGSAKIRKPSEASKANGVAGSSKSTPVASASSSIISSASAPLARRASTNGSPAVKRSNSVGQKIPPKSKSHERRASATVRMGEGSLSLMSIVEGVARQNKDGWVAPSAVPATTNRLQPIKAPPRVTRSEFDSQMPAATKPPPPPQVKPASPTPIPGSAGLGRSYTADNLVLPSTSGGLTVNGSEHRTKSPLRSALRNRDAAGSNSSREPSPNPPTSPPAAVASTSARRVSPPVPSTPASSVAAPIPIVAPIPVLAALHPSNSSPLPIQIPSPKTKDQDDDDDDASMLSYTTGKEAFEDAETETDEPAPPAPPPHDKAPYLYTPSQQYAQNYGNSGLSNESGSTETVNDRVPVVPQRRKSVRMSMHPTFSPTPPAFDDDEINHSPWGQLLPKPTEAPAATWESQNGRGSSKAGVDMWADSDEEDEDYAKAKRLLSKASRKGKAKA